MSNYWIKRQEEIFLAGEKKANKYFKELEKAFNQAKKELNKIVSDFYFKYADNNKVSYAEAQILLSKTEIKHLEAFIKESIEYLGQYNLELNNKALKVRMSRYEALERQIDIMLEELYKVEYEFKGKETLREIYADAYNQLWYSFDMFNGVHKEFATIDIRELESLINYPFNGANFSSRIWKQKNHLQQKLMENLTTVMIQGVNPKKLSKEFAKVFDVKKHEAYRLLHTEAAFVTEQATLNGYKEDGVEKYKILATLDTRTSEICRGEDGKIFNVEDAITGVNYPPYHFNCRTTTIPCYEDDEVSTRVARDPITDRSYTVPSNMTYKEWYNKYIGTQ